MLFLFSSVHMYTYQQEFICHYSRLSSVLDMDSVISQQSLREVQLGCFLYMTGSSIHVKRHVVQTGFFILWFSLVLKVQNSKCLRTFALIVSAHPYCARKFTCHEMHRARALSTKMNNGRADGHCYSFPWI